MAGAAKGTGSSETGIVDQDDENIGCALGWPQFLDRRVLGVRVFGVVGREAHVWLVWDGKIAALDLVLLTHGYSPWVDGSTFG